MCDTGEQTPFGLIRIALVVVPFLYVGTQISKNFAALLEEHDIFVPEDDDDDDWGVCRIPGYQVSLAWIVGFNVTLGKVHARTHMLSLFGAWAAVHCSAQVCFFFSLLQLLLNRFQ